MPLPIICAYDSFQQYLISYRDLFSKPQYKYFVIVLENRLVLSQDSTQRGPRRQSQRPQSFLRGSPQG